MRVCSGIGYTASCRALLAKLELDWFSQSKELGGIYILEGVLLQRKGNANITEGHRMQGNLCPSSGHAVHGFTLQTDVDVETHAL